MVFSLVSWKSGENVLASKPTLLRFFFPPRSVRSLALLQSNQATLFLILLSEKNLKFSETIQYNV